MRFLVLHLCRLSKKSIILISEALAFDQRHQSHITEIGAYLDIINPALYSVLAAFDIHDARTTSTAQEYVYIVIGSTLLQFGDFLARGDVMGANESIPETCSGAHQLLSQLVAHRRMRTTVSKRGDPDHKEAEDYSAAAWQS